MFAQYAQLPFINLMELTKLDMKRQYQLDDDEISLHLSNPGQVGEAQPADGTAGPEAAMAGAAAEASSKVAKIASPSVLSTQKHLHDRLTNDRAKASQDTALAQRPPSGPDEPTGDRIQVSRTRVRRGPAGPT